MSRSETKAPDKDREMDRLRAALQEQKASTVRGRDADRSAIARELHDRFGQYLTVLDLELGAMLQDSAMPPQLQVRLEICIPFASDPWGPTAAAWAVTWPAC